MGIYRYILSVMVLLSHSERMLMLNGKYINQGKIAVISFLLMTGYTNCFSLKRLDRGYSDYLIKRVLRIWPMYAVTTLLIYLIVGLFDFPYETIAEVTLRGIIADVLLLPRSVLNEVLISNAIPAAWTVGLQMVYYFISPLLYKLTKEQETSTSAVVIFLFIYGTSFATFALSMLNVVSPGYSYSVFWGMLWVFMAGLCLTEAPSKGMLSIVSVSWGVCAALSILYFINPEEYLFSNIESAIGFVIGLPLIAILKRAKRSMLDNWLGMLSYGVYLCHFGVKCTMLHLADGNGYSRVLVIVISTAVALLLHWAVEMPVDKLVAKRNKKETM